MTASGAGFYLAVTAVALLAAVYLTLHVIGLLFKLMLLAAAAAIAVSALRAWRVGD